MNHTHDVNTLIASDYEGLHSDIRTLSICTNAGPVLHILLNKRFAINHRLVRIFESSIKSDVARYDYNDQYPLWVDIPLDCIDLDIGLHDYVIELVNIVTSDTIYQYFSYRIQSDDTDKSYVYMSR